MAAAECGAKVLVLKKTHRLGGTTGIAVGSFTASRTVYQRRSCIEDHPDDHEADAARFGPPEVQAKNNSAAAAILPRSRVRHARLVDGDGLAVLWAEPRAAQSRASNAQRGAERQSLHCRALEPPVALGRSNPVRLPGRGACHARRPRDGAVAGCQGQMARFAADRGVVLAAGDYANSPEMIARYKGAGVHGRGMNQPVRHR